jgi:adenine phosphoribosyltransferase
LNIPFIPIRKKNKLPGKVYSQKYKLEYGYDEIQVHQSAIVKKDKILIVDDLIATGGTALASAKLINKFIPLKICFFFIINLQNLEGLNKIKKDYEVKILLETEG